MAVSPIQIFLWEFQHPPNPQRIYGIIRANHIVYQKKENKGMFSEGQEKRVLKYSGIYESELCILKKTHRMRNHSEGMIMFYQYQ